MKTAFHFRSISEFHAFFKLTKPEHPLISLIDYSKVLYPVDDSELKWIQHYYSIGLKRNVSGRFNYGQQSYDFDSGVLTFVSPLQFLRLEINPEVIVEPTGWLLLIHPDFLWGTALAKKIKTYEFFQYAVHEALFLSEREEQIVIDILQNIRHEYRSNLDKFSQHIIASHIELLLNYAERFYQRQFITRKKSSHQLLERLETILDDCFNNGQQINNGLPTAQYIADLLNVSPNYLGSLLKTLTGQTTQQHIHNKLIETAKQRLSTTTLSISEIAYELGFEHPQSFSKLFKAKTAQSPLEFRQAFI
jgi:Response regulator containing CheY-like receiver domain and AraC-type DNA-binding domain